MVDRVTELRKRGEALFGKRWDLLSLWQELGDHFYPERAMFTDTRNLGDEFAAGLMTSFPLLARRDLGNAFSAMLRPTTKKWFQMSVMDEERLDNDGRAWLQWATETQRRAMYDRVTQFVRATKEGDHDFAAFGQCVISTELNTRADALLFRCWHLRDVAWCENAEGAVDTVYAKWKPEARMLVQMFPKTVSQTVKYLAEKSPFETVNCCRAVMPADDYGGMSYYDRNGKKIKSKFVSVYYEEDTGEVLEERGLAIQPFVIPRWQTVSGSQYSYSPATVAALADARTIQAMTRVLLEAGEKYTNPPMIAVKEALRSDVALYAGGITWVDAQYDERLGEVLRPLTQDKSGYGIGQNMQMDLRGLITEAFFLNKLSLPPPKSEAMTAFEASQRVSEYVRQALPLFEPMETEYNAPLCENTFELLLRAGAFGSPFDMPRSLMGSEVRFVFQSPLRSALDEQKSVYLQNAKALLAQVVDLDPSSSAILDAKAALRDALHGVGVPAKWLRSEQAVADIQQRQVEQQQSQQLLQGIQQGGEIAKTYSEAARAGSQAGGEDELVRALTSAFA